MSTCININNPEFKKLAEDTNLNKYILASKIKIWQEDNNQDRFPTLDELRVPTHEVNAGLKVIDILGSDTSNNDLSDLGNMFDNYYEYIPYRENKLNQASIDKLKVISDTLDKFSDEELFNLITDNLEENYDENSKFLNNRSFEAWLGDIKVRSIRENIQEYKEGNRFKGKDILLSIAGTDFSEYIDLITPERNVKQKENIYFNRETQAKQESGRAIEIFTKIADRLADKLGVEYKIITPEEAQEITKDSSVKWNGEGAFLYKNKVYVLQDSINLTNGIHEYGHVLIAAVSKNNPELFQKLYNDFIATPEGAQINQIVRDTYSDFDENNIQQEILNRGLTALAEEKIISQQSKTIFQKLLFAIRQLFRKIFGEVHNIGDLNENTDLNQLAEMLTGDNLKIETNVVSDDDVIKFARDSQQLIKDFKELDNSVLNKSITRFNEIMTKHAKDVLNTNYKDVKETVTGETERNDIAIVRDIIRRATELGDSIEDMNKKAQQLAHTIDGIDMFTAKILDRLRELNTMPDHKERLGVLSYYGYMLNDWSNTMREYSKELNEQKISASSYLYEKVSAIESKINNAIREINKNNEPALKELISDMVKFIKQEIDVKHYEKLATYDADLKKGNTSAQRWIDEENKKYKQRFDLSDESILEYLQGKKGDTNAFSGFLEAYISSPDPIVEGFTQFIKFANYEVEEGSRKFSQNLRMELDPLFKKLNVNRGDPAQLGTQLTFVDTVLHIEDGKPVEGKVYSLLNPFKDYRYDIALLNHKIDKAKIEDRKEDLYQLRGELLELEEKYMHREYTDTYYEAQKIWKTPVGQIAYNKRKDLYDRINDIQDTLNEDPLIKKQQLEEIRLLRRQVTQLASLRDLNGNIKTNDDLEIAKVIRQYNETTRNFYDSIPIKGLFENRYIATKQELIDKGLVPGQEDFETELDNWVRQNTRQIISQDFYRERERITSEIEQIVKMLPEADQKKLLLGDTWKEIIDIVYGCRDKDGQPIGTDLTENQTKKIKNLQEKLLIIKNNFASKTGLTNAQQQDLSDLYQKAKLRTLTINERKRLETLLQAKNKFGLSPMVASKYMQLIQELQDLSSKVATEYYTEIVNNYLSKIDVAPITEVTADVLSNPVYIEALLEKDEEFEKWFHENHIVVNFWNNDLQMEDQRYERLYIWNRIQPNNEDHYEKTILSDGTEIKGLPTYDYYRRQIKNEYRTERIVGKTIDNKNQWLPKTMSQRKPGVDSKYINERYNQMSVGNPDMFKLLNIATKYHFTAQEEMYYGNKLGYDIPRFRKDTVQYLREGTVGKDIASKAGEIKEGIGSLLTKRKDDYVTENANYSSEIAERLVQGDMFDNKISRVPIKGLSNLPLEQVSLNVFESIIKYNASALLNKKLIEVSPYANALINVLGENGVNRVGILDSGQRVDEINQYKWLHDGVKSFIKSDKNVRQQIIKNIYERDILGKEHHMELGLFANKAANALMKTAAFGSLAFDIPGSVKNILAATVQNYIESLGGRYININEMNRGESYMTGTVIPAMIADYNKLSDQSIHTQLFQIFDPVQGKFYDKLGRELKNQNLSGFIGGHFAFAPRELGEIQAQGAMWIGMMIHQKVKQILNGVTKEIEYKDAFELVNGKVQLKDGIDKEWEVGGRQFMEFKLRLHELNQKLQGNYAKIDQPEMQRYTSLRLLNFMRRFFVPAAVNRFSKERMQVLGGTREGYYITSLRVAQNFIKDAKLNWHLYTDEEKGNVWKTLAEVGLSLTFMLILRSLGWNPNDPDKYKKLEDNSWATNMLIYELMAVKSESEQFIPIPGMGMDEIVRLKNTPSIAFGHFDKYYRLMNNAVDLMEVGIGMEDADRLQLQVRQGFWDKGDYKGLIYLARLTGFTGGTLEPGRVLVKNFNLIQSRTK